MHQRFSYQIRKRYQQLRPSEQKVADAVLERGEELAGLSIAAFAALAGVSQPTVIRFANAMGLKGFRELRQRVIEENARRAAVQGPEPPMPFELRPSDKVREVPAKVVASSIRHLEDALKALSAYEYTRAVHALLGASSIALYGVENSVSIVEDLAVKLAYLGFNCYTANDPFLQLVSAKSLGSKDVAVGISYTGRARQTVDALRAAKEAGAATIAITNFERAPIGRYADILLCTGGEQYLYGNAIFSRSTQTAVVDMLYCGILLADFERFSEHIAHREAAVASLSYAEEEPGR